MNHGDMVTALKTNDLAIARRRGWNGKGQAIALMPMQRIAAEKLTVRTASLLVLIEGEPFAPSAWLQREAREGIQSATPAARTLQIDPYFVLYTAAGTWQPGWVASQADQLADDWEVLVDGVSNWRS